MITGLLIAIAVGVWLLLLVVVSAVNRAARAANTLRLGAEQWLREQQQASGTSTPTTGL